MHTARFDDRRLIMFSLLACFTFIVGCNKTPKPADTNAARKTLETALNSWKSGNTPDALLKNSSIQMVDPSWKAGSILRDFEIQGSEEAGHDLKVEVILRLEDKQGKQVDEKVKYTVATSPKQLVIRADEMQ